MLCFYFTKSQDHRMVQQSHGAVIHNNITIPSAKWINDHTFFVTE